MADKPVQHRILVADDEPSIVLLIKRRLENQGYGVITAAHGKETLEKARKEKLALIVLDHSMPILNGFDTCLELKKDAVTKGIPIVVLTASTEKGIEERYVSAGAVGVIYKPLVGELMHLIKRILAGEKIDWAEYVDKR